MPATWGIRFWPECEGHVFLSHCREDYDRLICPVYEELQRRNLIPFIDRHHYPAGRDAYATIREELLKCRHVIYFLTPAALAQGRGWMTVERVLAELIQRQFTYGDEIVHVELPLLLLRPDDPLFQRSSWRMLADKACVSTEFSAPSTAQDWTIEHVRWCAETIERFVSHEERWSAELAQRLDQD